MKHQIVFALFLGCAFATAPNGVAKPSPAPGAQSSEASSATKMRAIPFHGMIGSIDEKAKSFAIAGKETSHVLKITDKTIITKGGQPATMKDVVANEEARGAYFKMADGSMEIKTLKLGPPTEAEKAAKEARREKREAKRAAANASPSAAASGSASP